MRKNTNPEPSVVKVELSNRPGVFATLDATDWTAWIAAGLTRTLFAAGNGQGKEYILHFDPAHPHSGASVARTLVNPGPGKVAKYFNGDPTDLRRANIYVTGGKTGELARLAERLATLRGPLINWR